MNLSQEVLQLIEDVNTSVGQELDTSSKPSDWDSVMGPKHESVLLDHGGKYGFNNYIIHIPDKDGVMWQVVEVYNEGNKNGEYIFYQFQPNGVTRRHGRMRYSEFLDLFGDK